MLEGIIVGTKGMYRSAIIPIRVGEILIFGRDAAVAHIIISNDATKISRKHCEVRFVGAKTGFKVADFSKNGTFINGKRMGKGQSVLVSLGSTISIGSEDNSFVLGAPLDDQTTIGLLGTTEDDTRKL